MIGAPASHPPVSLPDRPLSMPQVAPASGGVEWIAPDRDLGRSPFARGLAPWQRYCNRFNYTACNENTQCERIALQLRPAQRLFSVTAGGGRVLGLLLDQPREIWAVDLNPWQSHLLDLKIAALRALDYEAYLAFLGVSTSPRRWATYGQLEPLLSPASRKFFRAQQPAIERGVLLQGNLERYFQATSRALGVLWGKNRRTLFSFQDLQQQRLFIEKTWDSRWTRLAVQWSCRRKLIEWLLDDPGFTRFLPPSLPLHRSIQEAIGNYMKHNLARGNPLLTMIFFGNYVFEESKPIYLQRQHYTALQKALSATRIRIFTGTAEEVLRQAPEQTFDAYSFSDIGSYMTDEVWERHLDQVLRTARPGARFCARHIFGNRPLAQRYAQRLRRDPSLEAQLSVRDHAMVHQFLVAEVQ